MKKTVVTEKEKVFFEDLKKFLDEQEKQKIRGLNDYNILTTVLSPHDEVRLHSRMIGSLLNPDGLHYQNTLFLELFLKHIKINDFTIELASLDIEHNNIDLYLTDRTKHIIIENKVYAGDQESQIKRYIEKILDNGIEEKNIEEENILVVYLSIDRESPTEFSLGKTVDDQDSEYFELKDSTLHYKGNKNEILKNKKIKFKSIKYKQHILPWLEECKYQIQNITNLNEAIRQYIDVVKIINGEYESKFNDIKNFIGDKKNIQLAEKIANTKEINLDISEYQELKKIIKNNFVRTVDELYQHVGIKVGNGIKEKIPDIEKVHPFIIGHGNKLYANYHYIKLSLKNGIGIQLKYKNYFELEAIEIRFHETKNNSNDEKKVYAINIDFGIDFYELLVNDDQIDKLCDAHINSEELINTLRKHINEWKAF